MQLTLDCFQKWRRVCSDMFINCSIRCDADQAPFCCEFADKWNFQRTFGFRQKLSIVPLFSNMVFLGSARRLIIETSFSWTHSLAFRANFADCSFIYNFCCPFITFVLLSGCIDTAVQSVKRLN